MKKSKMIAQVAEYLLDSVGVNFDECENYAKDIVDILVKAGMKPPIKKKCPVLHREEYTWEQE